MFDTRGLTLLVSIRVCPMVTDNVMRLQWHETLGFAIRQIANDSGVDFTGSFLASYCQEPLD